VNEPERDWRARPPDPIEAALEPFSVGTGRWIAI
jgi:hypothetical protein